MIDLDPTYAHASKVARLATELQTRNPDLSRDDAVTSAFEMMEDEHVLDMIDYHKPNSVHCEWDDWKPTR